MDKQKKTALITGAANGIGKFTSELLASKGCNLVIVDKNTKQLNNLAKLLTDKYGIDVKCFSCNISNQEEVENIKLKINNIDFLVNLAGRSINQKMGYVNLDDFNLLINDNLKSAYLTCMIFGYGSINSGGAIVNVSSIRARTGTNSYSSIYSATKSALLGLTKSMALELADKNIRVNAVAPGPTYPTKTSKMWTKKFRESLASTIPLKRLAKPIDIANAIYFLLSKESSYITGQTIDVNGGLWMN